jgi:hypothetical protein
MPLAHYVPDWKLERYHATNPVDMYLASALEDDGYVQLSGVEVGAQY